MTASLAEQAATAAAPTTLAGPRAARVVGWVRQCFSDARAARSTVERQWYLNMAFFAGRQNVEFRRHATSPLGVRLAVPEAPPWRVRLVINRIRPIVRKEQAKLTSAKPQYVAVAATTEDTDIAAARAAEKLLEATWADLRLDRVQRDVVWWSTVCGTAFFKDLWDARARDIRVLAVDPFHVFVPDLREPDLDAQPWVIHATTRTPEWVRATLGREISRKATVASTEQIMEDVLTSRSAPRPTQQVLCLEAWVGPGVHQDLPAGGLIQVCGDQLITYVDYESDGPVYAHGERPFSKHEHIPMGRFYGASSIEDLVPLQRELNKTRSAVVENKNAMGRGGKWIFPEGCVDPTAITSEPGQGIPYKLGFGGKPEMIKPPELPAYVMQQVEQLQVDFDDVSGQHQISRGFAPSHTAASAIAYLQEQDDTLLAYSSASLEDADARVGRHILSHIKQFWDAPRLIRTVGADGSFDARMFAASDLRGVVDVRVQVGSSLPVSKSARNATLMDLYSKGAFGAPGAPSAGGEPSAGTKLLTALDLGGLDKAMEDWEVDRRQVDRENILLAAGQPVPVNAYDNDPAHIAGHQRFQKGQEFAALPPQVQQLFADHVAEHQAKQMAAATLTADATGGAGLAGPPGTGPAGLPAPGTSAPGMAAGLPSAQASDVRGT